jgi:hypothetical protein
VSNLRLLLGLLLIRQGALLRAHSADAYCSHTRPSASMLPCKTVIMAEAVERELDVAHCAGLGLCIAGC